MVGARGRIAFVTRELAPFGGGGIGPYVRATADLLAATDGFEPTIFTTSRHLAAYEGLREQGGAGLPRAPIVFVDEPRSWDARRSYNLLHEWSARVHAALASHYGDHGPHLIEFPDFLGEGCVTVQARRTRAPWMRETRICARAYGTAEIYDVLDGFLPDEQERAFTYELERYALRYADNFLWPGGDVLDAYERFYGAGEIAGAVRVRHPLAWEGESPPPAPGPASGPLRVLYFGRLERRKGVRALLGALRGIDEGEWRLTLVGGDTETAPLGQSMRDLLAAEIAGDARIELRERIPRGEIPALIDSHDLVAVPSLWECWPNVALEAMERGRPVLTTPTGGMVELVTEAENGWFAAGTSEADIRRALRPLVAEPERARAAIDPDRVRAAGAALAGAEEIAAAYAELCEPPTSTPASTAGPASEQPLVSVVIPYFEMDAYVEAALDSVAAQTYPSERIEIVIVNDGSFRPEDAVLEGLAERHGATLLVQPNSGLGAARNLGIAAARGSYIVPLDPDNVLEPGFIARCVEALEADQDAAYVTSWLHYIDERGGQWKGTEEGLRPIGNSSAFVERHNVAGDATALFRRDLLDRHPYSLDVAGFEDWALYRELRRADAIGHVIPEALIGYRVRGDSMMRTLSSPREQWIERAIEAHLREREFADDAGASPSRDEALAAATAKLAAGRSGRSNTAAAAKLALGDGVAVEPLSRRMLAPVRRVRLAARRALLRVLR